MPDLVAFEEEALEALVDLEEEEGKALVLILFL
jgi:hypothetical protein